MIYILSMFFQSWFISNEDNFAQEVEKHMVVDFSLLELRLLKAGHVFGALLFHLRGITRISRGLQRLKIVLERSLVIIRLPLPVSYNFSILHCVIK